MLQEANLPNLNMATFEIHPLIQDYVISLETSFFRLDKEITHDRYCLKKAKKYNLSSISMRYV